MSIKLLISCADQKGIVHEVTKFVFKNNGNIIDSQQHSLGLDSRFFMRLEIDASQMTKSCEELTQGFSAIADKFSMDYSFVSGKKKMAILVSKYDHCLYDILQKIKAGVINLDVPIIISNHPDLEHIANNFNIPYKYLPVTDKVKQEKEILEELAKHDVDFIAMARYMQILSPSFINHYKNRIINVHHSFLPSFKGANPYKQAYEKGVKVIGATAHYATEDLDMGPIIAQDVAPVDYKHSLEDYKSIGADIEKIVFAKAIKAHADDKIIIYNNKTNVFD